MIDDKTLVRHIKSADIVPLALSLAQISGDLTLLERVRPFIRGPWAHQAKVPDDLQREICDGAAKAYRQIEAGGTPKLTELDDAILQNMLSVAVGEEVAQDYVAMAREQIAFHRMQAGISDPPKAARRDGTKAIIVGAGVSGIAQAVRFRQAGIPFVLLEKNASVGGTWFENVYPGCAVDTPNHFYEYSFATNDDWPEYYSGQQSILDYLVSVCDRFDLWPDIRLSCEVSQARYDEDAGRWSVRFLSATDGETVLDAQFLVTAVGQLNRPAKPAIAGLENFAGPVVHTAEWRGMGDVRGKRVALVGTGASAAQIGPAILPEVEKLTIFQRTGTWISKIRNLDRKVSAGKKWVLANLPFYGNWYRFQMFWAFADGLYPVLRIDPDWNGGRDSVNALNARLRDRMVHYMTERLAERPDLLAKVKPDYPPYGKRVVADAGWFDMLLDPKTALETDAIDQILEKSIRLSDGREIDVDTIILATGFHAGRMLWPMEIIGTNGTIRDKWGEDDPSAYLGMTVPDFPNMFVLYGPNTGLGHGGSVMFLAECQAKYVTRCISLVEEGGFRTITVDPNVHDNYRARIDREMQSFVWAHPNVNGWYKNSVGRIIINQPGKLIDYWASCQKPQQTDFHFA